LFCCRAWMLVLAITAVATTTLSARAQELSQSETGLEKDAPVQAAKSKKKPMNSYAFGLQIGIAHVGTGDVRNPTYVSTATMLPQSQLEMAGLIGEGCSIIDKRCTTKSRRGVRLSFPLQIGGSIIGFRLEPYMALASAAKAYGVYMGPTFEFRVADPLYLGFGFGLQVAWVKDDSWKYAADIYGRIPLRVSYYVIDQLALVLEFGFGAGASGYVSELRDVINPATGRRIARRTDMTFGFGRTWDLSIGIRFP
jgi:hypothetical protein